MLNSQRSTFNSLLIFTDWFSPAYKAGGPIRSIVNLVDRFKEEYAIHVFTSDRDLNEQKPFEGIVVDQWVEQDGYKIWYYSPGSMTYKKVKEVFREVNPDKMYLNSMFSNMILPLMAAGRSGKIILAPRGMLRVSALSIKPLKKYFYLSFLRMLNIDQSITFHSTGKDETNDIRRIFPRAANIVEAPNLPVAVNKELIPLSKTAGTLRMVFVGRMHPIKNLLFLLESMQTLQGNIEFDIIATTEDQSYAALCNNLIDMLRERMQIHVHLDLPHHHIKPILEKAHVFVLPTEGENFGHAIFEALAVGCPVIISNQTPWKDLSTSSAGFDLPLSKETFSLHLQKFIDMDDAEWQGYRKGAWQKAQQYEESLSQASGYTSLFTVNQ